MSSPPQIKRAPRRGPSLPGRPLPGPLPEIEVAEMPPFFSSPVISLFAEVAQNRHPIKKEEFIERANHVFDAFSMYGLHSKIICELLIDVSYPIYEKMYSGTDPDEFLCAIVKMYVSSRSKYFDLSLFTSKLGTKEARREFSQHVDQLVLSLYRKDVVVDTDILQKLDEILSQPPKEIQENPNKKRRILEGISQRIHYLKSKPNTQYIQTHLAKLQGESDRKNTALERRSDHSSEIYKGLIKDLQKLDKEIDRYQKMLVEVEVSRPLVTTIADIFGGKKNTKRRKTIKNKTRKSYKKK